MEGTVNEKRVKNQINDVLEKIIYRRKRLGLSQTDLAKKLKVTLSGYYKMETGKTKLDIRRLLELSEILNVKINYFLKDENN
ncbi:MAG: transcriptional regulator with XRE-family HTH domain [Polaribacter sp.]|jgi:transcriptional regulator with XRE-family HTH domain